MKLLVTLDRYDGSQSKSRMIEFDGGIGMSDLLFMMMERDVCGATLTKVDSLERIQEHMRRARANLRMDPFERAEHEEE